MTILINAGGGNWSSGATWVGGVAPIQTDDVNIAALTGTLTIDGTSGTPNLCKSLTCTGAIGTISHAAAKQLNVGDPAGSGAGVFLMVAGVTYVPSATSLLKFVATSGTSNITSAAKAMGPMTFDGVGGTWSFQDAQNCIALAVITLTNGSLNTNNQNVGATNGTVFVSSNSNTRSLTLGTTTWTLPTGAALTIWDITTSTGMSLSAASSTINTLNASQTQTFQGGGLSYGTLTTTVMTTGNQTIAGANTFTTFTSTGITTGSLTFSSSNSFTTLTLSQGASAGNAAYRLGGNLTVSGTFTSNGNSDLNRTLIRSTVKGTQRTISAGTVTVTRIDLQDILGSGAGSWNIAAVTGGSGDCLGNSGITFTTPRNAYMKTAVSVNWSASNWYTTSGGATLLTVPAQPLPQDTAIFDANSITAGSISITLDASAGRIPGMNFTGVTNTPTLTCTSTVSIFGAIVWVSGMTISGGSNTTMENRGTSINTGGKTWTMPMIIDSGGTVSFGANFSSSSTLVVTAGTLTGSFTSSYTTLTVQGGTFTLGGNATFSGALIVTSGTLNGSGTISGTTLNISGGTFTLGGNLTLTGSMTISAGTLDMNGYNISTPTNLAFSGTGDLKLNGTITATGTYTSSNSFTIENTSGTITGITSSSFGSSGLQTIGTLTQTGALTLTAGTLTIPTAITTVGAPTLSGGTMNLTPLWAIGAALTVAGSTINTGTGGLSSTTFSITSGAFTSGASGVHTCTSTWASTGGTYTDGGAGVSATTYAITGASARTVTMAGTWTATSTGQIWDATTTTNLTFNRGSSTILISNTAATARNMVGGALTYNNLTLTTLTPAALTISGSNTFNTITMPVQSYIILTAGTTTTVTTLSCNGNSTPTFNGITSSANASTATISIASGTTTITYTSIRDIIATGGATFNATSCANVGNNTGISFASSYACALGAGGNWNAAATWSTGSGFIPNETTDVYITFGAGTITLDGLAATPNLCRGMDAHSFMGTITAGGTSVLQVGDQNGSGAGVFKLQFAGNGSAYNPTSGAIINFISSSTGNNITFNGQTMPIVVFNNATGSWIFQDSARFPTTSAQQPTLTAGTLNTNNQTITTSAGFLSNNSNTRSLILGTSTWNISNLNTTLWDISTATGMTLSAASSTIAFLTTSSSPSTFNGGGLIYGTLTASAMTSGAVTTTGNNTFTTITTTLTTGTLTIGGNNTITTFTNTGMTTGQISVTGTNSYTTCSVTGGANQNAAVIFGGTQTISGTLTMAGNSVINRLLIASTTAGTPITISAGTVTTSHSDWRDITGSGAGSWNLSAITGLSGDCQGNSGITFTTPENQYWVPQGGTSTGSMSVTTRWATASNGTPGTGRAPLPQDSCIFDASSIDAGSRTITCDMPRIGSINWTGATNTPAWAKTFAQSTACYGSVTMINSMTQSGTTAFIFRGQGSTTFTAGSTTWTNNILIILGAGTLTQQDNLTSNSTGSVLGDFGISSGTYNTGAHTSTFSGASALILVAGGTYTVGGTLTISGATAAALTITGGTLDATGQIISHSAAGSAVTFSGGTLNVGTFTRTARAITNTGCTITIGAGGVACSSLTNTSGTMTIGAAGFTCSTGFSMAAGSVTVNGASSCTTFGVTGGTFTSTGNITGTGAITISAGTISMSSNIMAGTTYANSTSGTASFGTLTCSSTISISCTSNGTTIGTGGCTCTSFSQTGIGGSFTTNATGLLNCSSTYTISGGTFVDGGGGVTATTYSITGASVRAITMAGTWTASGTGTVWDATTVTSLTFTKGASTIAVTNVSASATAFIGGALTYNNITVSGAASVGALTISTACTFNVFTANQDASIKFTITTTYTATTWTLTSIAAHLITVQSTTAATTFTLSAPTYTITQWNYVSLKDCTASVVQGASWYAGANSTNVSGNVNWSFASGPATIAAAAGGGNWSATTTWTGANVPQPADDVTIGGTVGALSINGTAAAPSVCRSLDFTGYTNTCTAAASSVLTIGDSAGGKLTLASDMTQTTWTNLTIKFVSTWATVVDITSNGKVLGTQAITFNGVGGSWRFVGDVTVTSGAQGTITLTNGSLNTNGVAVGTASWGIDLSSSNANTRSLTLGATTWTCAVNWTLTTSTGMSLSAASSTIVNSTAVTASTTFAGGGLTYGTYAPVFTSTGNRPITGANTFGTLTLDSSSNAVVTNNTTIASNLTVSGTLLVKGNAAGNRMLIRSVTHGTQITLTVATNGSWTYTNIFDIVASGGASWNLSAITGGCGGGTTATNCSGITFTDAVTSYWVPAATTGTSTGNFSTAANWASSSHGSSGTGRPPLPQDSAIFDVYSFNMTGYTVTLDQMPGVGNITFTGITNSPAFSKAATTYLCGSLTVTTGMTVTSANVLTFIGGSNVTLTTAGISFTGGITVNKTAGATFTQQDNLTVTSNIIVNTGTWVTNGYTINNGGNTMSQTGGVWTITSTLTVGTLSITGGTLNASKQTINCTSFTTATGGTATIGAILSSGAMTINGATVILDSAVTQSTIVGAVNLTSGSLTVGLAGLDYTTTITLTAGTFITYGAVNMNMSTALITESVKGNGLCPVGVKARGM